MDHKSLESLWSDRLLVALIPYTLRKWSKRPGKGDSEGKVLSTCFAHFWCSPCKDVGCLLALAGQYKYKLLIRFPFGGLPSVITRNRETAEQGSMLASCRAYHPFIQAHRRVSKAENLFTEKAERQLSVFLLWPEDPGPAPKVMTYGEQCRIHDLRRRRISFGTRDQAWSLKSFCVAEFY